MQSPYVVIAFIVPSTFLITTLDLYQLHMYVHRWLLTVIALRSTQHHISLGKPKTRSDQQPPKRASSYVRSPVPYARKASPY